jgi:hypothetical protein
VEERLKWSTNESFYAVIATTGGKSPTGRQGPPPVLSARAAIFIAPPKIAVGGTTGLEGQARVEEEACIAGDAGARMAHARVAKEETNENRCCFIGWNEYIAALRPKFALSDFQDRGGQDRWQGSAEQHFHGSRQGPV